MEINTAPIISDGQSSEAIRIPSMMPRSCGFLRITTTKSLEIELYDHSDRAHSVFGNDASTFYTIPNSQLSVLSSLLMQRERDMEVVSDCQTNVNLENSNIEGLCKRVADSFKDIDSLLIWLKSSGLEFHAKVNSWV